MSVDIKVIELERQECVDLQSSKLIIQISGKTVNDSLVNSLRRTLINDIPTYAFNSDSINISENTSIFDNDEMRIRLSQITIVDVLVPITNLDDEYCTATSYSDPNRLKDPNDKLNIELFINAINSTQNNINVTTNDCQVYIDGELVQKFDSKFPHLLVQLKPKQVFKVRAVANLGVALVNNIWSGVSNAFYDIINEDKHEYKFTLLSQGQMNEYELLYRACSIVKYKLAKLRDTMQSGNIGTEILKKNSIRLKLEGVNYTIGGLINEYLQINDNVSYSAITKQDLLVNEVVITLVTIGKQPLDVFYEVINYCTKIYDDIEKQIVGFGKKHINLK